MFAKRIRYNFNILYNGFIYLYNGNFIWNTGGCDTTTATLLIVPNDDVNIVK